MQNQYDKNAGGNNENKNLRALNQTVDSVLEKLLQNKIGVLFDIGHIIEPAFQVLFIEPAYSSSDSFERQWNIWKTSGGNITITISGRTRAV